MDDTVLKTVTIQPKTVYGIRSEIRGNIHFTLKREIIYPVESVLAFHDFVTNKQKFLRLPENTKPLIISISPDRRMLAILESFVEFKCDENYNISVYDLITMKKRRSFIPPKSLTYKQSYEIAQMIFTQDSRSIIILTKPPEETVILFMFDKSGTIIMGRATEVNQNGFSDCIASNPQDSAMFALGGENIFKLMSTSEKGFNCTTTIRKEGVRLTSLGWLSLDTCIAGTSDSRIFIYEGSELKLTMSAIDTKIIDLAAEQEEDTVEKQAQEAVADALALESGPKRSAGDSWKRDESVVCLTVFSKGIAYVIFNQVFVFEKESRFKFIRKTILTLKVDLYPEKLYQICNISVNAQQDTVIVTAKHNQIYYGKLIVPASLQTQLLDFKPLGEYIHIEEIIDVTVCSWRPIIITASKDKTVRLWNYETEKVELVRKFQVEVTVVELNPNGFFVAIGFFDQLRVMEIFLDDFRIIKTYNFPRCRDIKYSNFGHLMAAAFDTSIAIVSVYNLEILKTLKGHNGDVLSLSWSRNDKYLISGGKEGAIYQWDVETGTRVHEFVQKGIEFRGVAVTNSEPLSIYAITSLGTLREVQNSLMIREIPTPSNNVPLLSLSLAKSDLILFLSNERGHLYNCQLPFMDAGGGSCTNYRFFNSSVTKCCISYDGTLLITASAKGTLAIWVMKNIEGRVASIDPDLLKGQEILISRTVIQDKIDTIANLELRLKQQVEEYEYKRIQTEAMDEQEIAAIHKHYSEAIEELKNKNNKMELDHVEDLNQITCKIDNLKEEHHKEMQELADQYSERMLNEFHKFNHLRENMLQMRDKYEEKLKGSALCLQDTVEALETDFKKELHERQEIIRQLMQEMEDKKNEFVEYCRQVEADNDRNMVESKLAYEKKLKDEQDTTFKWRDEAGILKKKYDSLNEEANDLREEVDTLKEEHRRDKREIERQIRVTQDLHRELEERDFIISEKEKRIQDLMRKNQELEKYKQILNHKISELREQIEPREQHIKEKRNHIIELEKELEDLHESNLKSDLRIKELKDKYLSSVNELKLEKQRAKVARNYATKICTDIYYVAGNLNKPDLLKEGITNLFKKYCDDQELKKDTIMEESVQNEFESQRSYLERIAASYKKQDDAKDSSGKLNKLIKENVQLIEELNSMRSKLKEASQKISSMEGLINVGFKLSPAQIKQKIEKSLTDIEKIEEKHKRDTDELRLTLSELVKENQKLRDQISDLRGVMSQSHSVEVELFLKVKHSVDNLGKNTKIQL
ncbi:cilia- and flagella-associated protein 57, partial [Condylostylus longicornis]|uniref:cilia- and flagella-associated protein 57 n=1 Tax=Condylostylus longicornis TaxID=2530218 RepID=UPI00244DB1BE